MEDAEDGPRTKVMRSDVSVEGEIGEGVQTEGSRGGAGSRGGVGSSRIAKPPPALRPGTDIDRSSRVMDVGLP